MQEKPKLLIVEDDEPIRSGLVDLFVFHGYSVESVSDGEQGLQAALRGQFDLIILDVMLPSRDGFSVCNEIRKTSRTVPIIMLTAKASDDDIITGLTLGADDYVSKPFSIRQLVLRAEAVLRRTRPKHQKRAALTVGMLTIDADNLTGTDSGRPDVEFVFTRREVDILTYLSEHPDRPISREELLSEVWGYQKAGEIETRTVDIHIAKLRKKIERDPKKPLLLVTVRGEGYRIEDH